MAAIYQWLYGINSVCGNTNQLSAGQLLTTTAIPFAKGNSWETSDPVGEGINFADTKSVCFTVFFVRSGPGYSLCADPDSSYLFGIWNHNNSTNALALRIDASGFLRLEGANSAGTRILDLTIKNNLGSFGDKQQYQLAVVINLDDSSKRAVWLNGVNITDDTNYCTWTTYTDDTLGLEDNGTTKDRSWAIGSHSFHTSSYWADHDGAASEDEYQAYGFLGIDDSCSLIPEGIWDSDGDIMDPQAWEGWFNAQPAIFMPSNWRNTGRFEPTDQIDPKYSEQPISTSDTSIEDTYQQIIATLWPNITRSVHRVNDGLGSKTEASL